MANGNENIQALNIVDYIIETIIIGIKLEREEGLVYNSKVVAPTEERRFLRNTAVFPPSCWWLFTGTIPQNTGLDRSHGYVTNCVMDSYFPVEQDAVIRHF
ncbi:hypothetical protein Glove_103g140 [Diversispora epigaea]|uniref:Uncharacterized protein n=1 Tax=Diversispora epigaea TaxID=1348612 RepID=A0A397JD22_9GLOM|nr:hypothetical protein Glove_103g140 [Diversispora epigaea]